MNVRKERRLISLQRRVPAGREEQHRELWADLAARVTNGGAHAWRFVARNDPALHLEFLEFEAGSDPRDWPPVTALLARLDEEVAAASIEEWLEPG